MSNSNKGKVTMGMPKFEGQEVMVVGQFNQPKLLKVEKPKKLCNPIDKNDEGIINPDTHLWRVSTQTTSSAPCSWTQRRKQNCVCRPLKLSHKAG